MRTLVKAQVASFAASVVDFTVTLIAAEVVGVWYGAGNVAGNVSGAVVNFLMNRVWVFKATAERKRNQAWKYACVWFGYIALNTGLVVVMTDFFSLNYMISKIISSIFLSVTYNYTLQKRFVFKP